MIPPDQILNKPSFKKYYGTKILEGYPMELIEFEQNNLIQNVKTIQKIWDYVSIDIIHNNISVLEISNISMDGNCIDWMRKNIKVESFLNMISKHYSKVGCIEIGTFLSDTINQLEKLIKSNVEVSPPKRWRMIDFHDHISYLYLKNTTKNQEIRTLIKPYKYGEYRVSQPSNSVEIIIWGKKVKNCVASYEERIGNKIWIFFIEKNGVPLYTVETDMSKKLNIKQIVSQCNGSVNNSEREFAQELLLNSYKNTIK